MIKDSTFTPAKGLGNAHLQTFYPTVARQALKVTTQPERVELADGDFLDLQWHGHGEGPIVLLLHGLAGSPESPYIKGLMQQLNVQDWRTVLMQYRGSSGVPNRSSHTYHLGQSDDLDAAIHYLQDRFPDKRLFCVGFSMGGNILLKWLGEHPEQTAVTAAIAVSAPYDLRRSAHQIRQGSGAIYQWLLMRDLRRYLKNKYSAQHAPIDLQNLADIKSFWDLDEKITAPLNGFADANDYYHKSSCIRVLKNITTPTLIIHATDDPLVPASTIPSNENLSATTTLELSPQGGHVGFVSGTWNNPIFWLEQRIPEFLTNHASLKERPYPGAI